MKKFLIIEQLLTNVQNDLKLASEALESVKQFKYESDMKQEHKYDTRGIEAGYLSDGQAKRVEELQLELKLVEEIPHRVYQSDEEIGIGALLEIEFNKLKKYYFLSTTSGGTMLNIEGQGVLVISVFSPIGSAVMGLKCGDSFELETQSGVREYTIRSVC